MGGGFKRSCAPRLVVCTSRCVFARHRKTKRTREQQRHRGRYISFQYAVYYDRKKKKILHWATAWGSYKLVSVSLTKTRVFVWRKKSGTLTNTSPLVLFCFFFFFFSNE